MSKSKLEVIWFNWNFICDVEFVVSVQLNNVELLLPFTVIPVNAGWLVKKFCPSGSLTITVNLFPFKPNELFSLRSKDAENIKSPSLFFSVTPIKFVPSIEQENSGFLLAVTAMYTTPIDVDPKWSVIITGNG